MAALERDNEAAANEATLIETKEETLMRHKKELKDMQFQNRQRMKQAKSVQGKGQKDAIAEANTLNLRSEDELQYRHRGELEAYEDNSDEEATPEPEPVLEVIENTKKNKLSKAAKKREKERQKAKEREERIAAEKAGAGPTPRDIELAIISEKIMNGNNQDNSDAPPFPPLRVYDILSDGHCLYRSVAHQLQLRGDAKMDFQMARKLAAAYMRKNPTEFVPFLDLEKHYHSKEETETEAFGHYCEQVESSSDWGGHLELLALSHALKNPIRVHSAENATPLLMGWAEYGNTSSPLEICYHLHFYALGEHYNSTLPL